MSLLIPHAPAPAPEVAAPIFALAPHGTATAVVHDGRAISYAELDRLSADFARTHYGSSARRLVLIEAANDVATVVAYLAALNHGHVALMAPAGSDTTDVVSTYDPDVVVGTTVTQRRRGTRHGLHPDLALLLSTSGSTGSPKLVRLSRENLTSNADAIAHYLGLRADDRAITSLPLHYCYGLSVLHSHLVRGAGVVLTDLSVVDECFWALCRRERVTTLSGVPYTFDLLDHSGFADRDPGSLRRITQAGGRLRPEKVREYAAGCAGRGIDFFVMYGQTEATARMAYLPPDLAATHGDAAGVAIPGGHLRIDPVAGEPDGVGEVVYAGPNVMLGYAHTADDLALGREVHELRTGDLGEFRDGLLHVVGRRNRHAKVFGLRIDLDRVEAQLSRPAHVVAGQDSLTVIGVHDEMPCLASEIATLCQLPTSAVRWVRVSQVPLKPNGKPDLQTLGELAAREQAQVADAGSLADQVRRHFGLVLGVAAPADDATFASLGGDSLSYAELATRLEGCLPGGLPADWHQRTLAELSRPARAGRRRLVRQDTTIALRALAILLIMGSHVELFDIMGGAHLLLAVAGFNFARFALGGPAPGRLRRTIASLATVVVPSTLWIGGVALMNGTYDWPTAVYLNGLLGADHWTEDWQFWFLEALVWPTLAAAFLLSRRAVAAWERAHPFALAVGVVAATAVVRYATVGLEAGAVERYAVRTTAMFFALGWAVARATTLRERLVVSALTLALVPGFFGMAEREAVIVVGILAILWWQTVPVPRALSRVTGHLATYSLCIYVTHWVVYPPLEADHPVLAVLASVAVGTAYGVLMLPVQRRVSRVIRRAGETRCTADPVRP